MVVSYFPPVEHADRTGLLAVGGDMDPETLLLAYTNGIFPWPYEEGELAWFSPPKRAVLFFKDLHIPRSLEKSLKKQQFKFALNTDFAAVIRNCAALVNRGHQNGTWITSDIIQGYTRLNQLGFAMSFEARLNGELVGGVYGVKIHRYFSGESMFYRVTNGSKFALINAIDELKKQGVTWIDCQVMTPTLKTFGAIEILRDDYLKLLKSAL